MKKKYINAVIVCCILVVLAGVVFYLLNRNVSKEKVIDQNVFYDVELPEQLQKDLYFKDYINKTPHSEEQFVSYNQQELENGLVLKVVTTSTQKENRYHFYIAFQQSKKLRLSSDYFAVTLSKDWACESGNVELALEEIFAPNEKHVLEKMGTIDASQFGYGFCIPNNLRKKGIYYGYTNFEAVSTSKEPGDLRVKYVRNPKKIEYDTLKGETHVETDKSIQTVQAVFDVV